MLETGNKPANRLVQIGLAAALALLVLLLYRPASHYDFIPFDDPLYISNNPHVMSGLTPANVRWAFTAVHEQWWLPVLWISYMLDVECQGPAPGGFHRTNIFLHALNAALLFWVLSGMTGSRGRSWFAAALFALHPLWVESVAWLTERKDVLAGLFFLLALLAYLHQVRQPSALRQGLVFGALLLGLMSKATVITLPLLLLLLDYWPLRRAGDPLERQNRSAWLALLREKIPLFALSLLFGFINLHTHVSGSGSDAAVPWLARLGLIAPNYWAYLAKIFWPVQLSALYPECDIVHGLQNAAAIIGLLAITGFLLRRRHAAPYALVGWLWFLVALLPVIRGVRLGLAAYADRFTYLPAIGLGIALVWSVGDGLQRHRNWRGPALLAGVLVLAACGILTHLRLPVWTNATTLFPHLLVYAPNHDMATLGYGQLLLDQGRPAEALPYLEKAIRLNPAVPAAAAAQARALLALDRNEDARVALQQAMERCGPADPDLNMLMARALLNTRQAAAALPYLEKAVAGQPANPGWQVEWIRALFEADQPDEARRHIQQLREQGISRFSDFDSLISHYGGLWLDGERLHAWHFFQNNLTRLPNDILLHRYAAWLLATDPAAPAPASAAVRLAEQARALNPRPDGSLLATLAAALAANGQYEEAQVQAAQALALAQQSGDFNLTAEISRQLSAYRQHQPWRESFPKPPEPQP